MPSSTDHSRSDMTTRTEAGREAVIADLQSCIDAPDYLSHDIVDAMKRAIALLRQPVEQWQGIESAPKDKAVLVWANEYGRFGIFAAKQDQYGWDAVGSNGYECETSFDTPILWQPLPAAPYGECK